MNAIDFLINEHNKVRKMLADIDDESHKEETKHKMFNELCIELIRHETMEQTVWYPYLKKDEKIVKEIGHLLSEEKSAAKAIESFQKNLTDNEWEKKFHQFKKDVLHHANEEETELFPRVKKVLDEKRLEEIGKDMREFKLEFNKQL